MKTTILSMSVMIFASMPLEAAAVEATSNAPVKIASCIVARDASQNDAQLPGPAATAGVTAVVVNTTTRTIKDMRISGIYDGVTVTDTVEGPFNPGQTYTLHKSHPQMVYTGPDASCVLNHVTFIDGTEWTMPAPPVTMH